MLERHSTAMVIQQIYVNTCFEMIYGRNTVPAAGRDIIMLSPG